MCAAAIKKHFKYTHYKAILGSRIKTGSQSSFGSFYSVNFQESYINIKKTLQIHAKINNQQLRIFSLQNSGNFDY